MLSDIETNKINLLSLILEDSEDDYLIIRDLFEEMEPMVSVTLDWASTVEQALELLHQREYSLILVDQNLGGPVKGTDFMRLLREQGVYVPAIMITGIDDGGRLKREAILSGFVDFMLKQGLKAETLRNAVQQAVNKRLDSIIDSLN